MFALTQKWGLISAKPVAWLIASDRGVYDAVGQFLEDKGNGKVDVAGPPTIDEMRKVRAKERSNLMLPTIRLNLEKTRHHLTQQPCLKITCSDKDLAAIESWRIQAAAAKRGVKLDLN